MIAITWPHTLKVQHRKDSQVKSAKHAAVTGVKIALSDCVTLNTGLLALILQYQLRVSWEIFMSTPKYAFSSLNQRITRNGRTDRQTDRQAATLNCRHQMATVNSA